ncbi:uncharacterized protein EKO05_0010695 [Ascochyta rabiei]|uniref:Uncharacterized protein n=1 Tax=Didymella rabiei TaxID=5454 RepID=A0A163L173_DIDRA|nr:uncharacterized protein EKO05_0010695 [Ascochyta rabiei]KZM27418.1 hypothetical protein ST47_g1404 [Ascochyta rabiei]UPX20465.1 hypothetical protein EKO05_0010695 [Ascochyta rabiei]
MLYSTALVLSTLAVGQAAAAHHHNRHASFHARRQADAKRSPGNDINWKAVAYDLNDVDWDKVNWSSVFTSPTPTPTAQQAQPTSTVAASSVVEQTTSAQAAPTSSAAVVEVQEAKTSAAPSSTVVTSSAAAASSSAPAATSSSSSDLGDLIGDVVSDLLEGVEDLCKTLGIVSTGKNDKSNNGAIWVGDDGDWKAEFTNDADEDAVIFCWKADGFSGMSLNVNQPEVSVGLKAGQKTVVSFAADVPSACAPAFKDTKLANFGGLDQTWWEVTFGQYGAFDVSRNVNMKGRTINSKGSKCESTMSKCVFKCKDDSVSSCEKGSDYDLFNCDSSSGGGGGYDPIMAGTGGGCSMASSGETIQVSFS